MKHRVVTAASLTELEALLPELERDGARVVSTIWDGTQYVIVTVTTGAAGGPYDGAEQR